METDDHIDRNPLLQYLLMSPQASSVSADSGYAHYETSPCLQTSHYPQNIYSPSSSRWPARDWSFSSASSAVLSSPVHSRTSDDYAKRPLDEYDEWEVGSTGSFTPDDYIHHESQPRFSSIKTSSRQLQESELLPLAIYDHLTGDGSLSGFSDSLNGAHADGGYSDKILQSSGLSLCNLSQGLLATVPDQSHVSPFPAYPHSMVQWQNQHLASRPQMAQMGPSPNISAVPPLIKRSVSVVNGSPLLQELLMQGRPTAYLALQSRFFPFTKVSLVAPDAIELPVVKLTNIPFNVSRNEVAVFLGRHHRVPDSHEPIHIMMCRNTGKTMEVFVELLSEDDLEAIWERYEEGQRSNRPVKMGGRAITVQKSSQSELMRKMFPTVGGIVWEGCVPVRKQITESQGRARRTFRGFISEEEVTMAIRHVEYPQKSPFSRGCPERAFEYLISTLRKYPWQYTSLIRLDERHNIFKLTFQLLDFLIERLPSKCHQGRLTATLLRRVLDSALRCPGFTPFMKANIAQLVGMEDSQLAEYGVPRNADGWRHQYGLVPKPWIPEDVIEWYIRLIREYTLRHRASPASESAASTIPSTPLPKSRSSSQSTSVPIYDLASPTSSPSSVSMPPSPDMLSLTSGSADSMSMPSCPMKGTALSGGAAAFYPPTGHDSEGKSSKGNAKASNGRHRKNKTKHYWGYFWRYFPERIDGCEFDDWDLESTGQQELAVVRGIVKEALS